MKHTKRLLAVLLLATSLFAVEQPTNVNDKLVVSVNGKKITYGEVLKRLMYGTKGGFTSLAPEKQQALFQQVVQNMVTNELIYSDAKKNGMTKSKEYKTRYQEELKALEADLKKNLAIQLWKEKIFKGIKVTDKELRSYYNDSKEEFMKPERVHAYHILVTTEDEAKKLIAQLKPLSGAKLKEKFQALAREKSTGPSGSRGGDLGVFTRNRMAPEFEKAVFNLQDGTITQTPVKTQYGYHVIYLDKKLPASTRSFDEVKEALKQRLKAEKAPKLLQEELQELQKNAVIKQPNQ